MLRRGIAIVSVLAMLLVPSMGVSAAVKLKATSAPKIAVSIAGGDRITATAAKWNQKVKTVSYQWFADAAAIKGASKSSFTVPNELVGKQLRVRATAKTSAGKTAAVFSNSVLVGDHEIVGAVTIDYAPGGGQVLTVTGIPKPAFEGYTTKFQWFRGGMDIEGATAESYTIGAIDRGKSLSVRVQFVSETHITKDIYSADFAVPELAKTYSLVWSDEFNGIGGANPNIWVPQEGDGVAYRNKGWGNRELQWYLGSQATQDGSVLNIKATRTGADKYTCYYGTCSWISSKLVTLNKVGFEYGRIEARIKGAPGEGTWGAFWTLGANIDQRGWPGCGEIDVTELLGRTPTTTLGYLHGPLSGAGGRGDRLDTGKNLMTDYHVYAVDWLEDHISWYIDGKLYAQVYKTDNDWVFDHEMYLILNLAMGGNLGGTIDPNLKDTTMSVDYVRFYTINGLGKVIQH